MEYEGKWQKCYLTDEETTLECPRCNKPTNIKVMKKIKIKKTQENFDVIYICKTCHEKR